MYLRNDWEDTLYHRIVQSKLGAPDKYVYSDVILSYLARSLGAEWHAFE